MPEKVNPDRPSLCFLTQERVMKTLLEDDNDNYVKHEHSYPTEYDKESPRVEITIEDYEEVDVDAQHYLF